MGQTDKTAVMSKESSLSVLPIKVARNVPLVHQVRKVPMDLLDLPDQMVGEDHLAHPVTEDLQGLLGHQVSRDRPDRKDQMDHPDQQESQERAEEGGVDRKDRQVPPGLLGSQGRKARMEHLENLDRPVQPGKPEILVLLDLRESPVHPVGKANQARMVCTALALLVQTGIVSRK